MADRDEGGGKAVAIPPPILFGVALVAGFVIHHALGREIPVPRSVLLGVGIVLAAIGIGFSVAVSWLFIRAHTPISPLSQPTDLVLAGPYRFSRNPDYIGQTLLCLGIGLIFDAPAVLAATVAAAVAVNYVVIPREERFLEQRFGEAYREYRRRVRRWL